MIVIISNGRVTGRYWLFAYIKIHIETRRNLKITTYQIWQFKFVDFWEILDLFVHSEKYKGYLENEKTWDIP